MSKLEKQIDKILNLKTTIKKFDDFGKKIPATREEIKDIDIKAFNEEVEALSKEIEQYFIDIEEEFSREEKENFIIE